MPCEPFALNVTLGARPIVFIRLDERGRFGLFVQEFAPGRDTTSTRRPIGGFFTDVRFAASFGISPDGTRLAIVAGRGSRSLVLAEVVAGVR